MAEVRVMFRMAQATVKAHVQRIAAQERLATVTAQRDALADELDELVRLSVEGYAVTDNEMEAAATLMVRVRVAQAAENGPDNV